MSSEEPVFFKGKIDDRGVEALNELAGIREKTTIQVSYGTDTGRKLLQVPLDLVYLFTSSGKEPSTCTLEQLPPHLQALVRDLLARFEAENGFRANNVLIQLYEPGAGIGRHPDNNSRYKVRGKILSYHGGQTIRTFVMYPEGGGEIRVKLEPGTLLFFWDGYLEHELLKPCKTKGVTREQVRRCASTRPRNKCFYLADNFACTLEECPSMRPNGHPCECPHQLRLNITIRFMVE